MTALNIDRSIPTSAPLKFAQEGDVGIVHGVINHGTISDLVLRLNDGSFRILRGDWRPIQNLVECLDQQEVTVVCDEESGSLAVTPVDFN